MMWSENRRTKESTNNNSRFSHRLKCLFNGQNQKHTNTDERAKKTAVNFIHKITEWSKRAYLHTLTQKNKSHFLITVCTYQSTSSLCGSKLFILLRAQYINVIVCCANQQNSHNSLWIESRVSAIVHTHTICINNRIQCDNVTVQYRAFIGCITIF